MPTQSARHAEACSEALSMSGMSDELVEHEQGMAEPMARMDRARERMRTSPMMGGRRCSGPSFEQLSASLSDVHAEMSRHTERMRGADAVDAARSECTAHATSMQAMMHGMMRDLDSMPCINR